MGQRIVLLIMFLGSIFSAVAKQNDVFELQGNVTNGNGKKIYFNYTAHGKEVSDSIIIINNHFVFKGYINCPTLVFLKQELKSPNSVGFYFDPTIMTTTLDYINFFETIDVKGSKTQNELKLFYTEKIKNINKQQDSVYKLYRSYREALTKTTDTLVKKDIKAKWSTLDKFNDQLRLKVVDAQLDYAKNNPDSFVSLSFLKDPLERRQVSYEVVNSLFNGLTQKVKHSDSGFEFLTYLEDYKKSNIGNLALDFSVKDVNGNPLVLSSFRNNQYVLLDFWASWCGPCRADMPELKSIYEKYHNKGFEIINITKDENSDSWRKAISKEDIGQWKHFSILENNSAIEKTYMVTSIPVKILIDKNGIIIGRWLGRGEGGLSELQKMLDGIFGKKI